MEGKAYDPTKSELAAFKKEPLTKTEKMKLFAFVVLNLLLAVVTGGSGAYIWFNRIVPNPTEQSNYIIFALMCAISGTSTLGVIGVSTTMSHSC